MACPKGWNVGGAVVFGVILALAACGDSNEPTPPSGDGGTISGTVSEVGGSGMSGVEVALSGGASRKATTSSNGGYRFTELEPGSYTVAVMPPSGYAVAAGGSSRTVTVPAGGSVTVDFELEADDGSSGVVVVELRGTSFSPSRVTISPGQTVRWVNTESVFHTVTPDGHNEWASASLNQQGQTFEHTFDEAGEFPYYCQPHQSVGMTGQVVVQ